MNKPWFFTERAEEPEILDDFDLGGDSLDVNMQELAKVNKLLGGNRILGHGIQRLWRLWSEESKPIHIVDIGCGGGESLIYLAHLARAKGRSIQLTGIDANAAVVEYARKICIGYPEISIRHMDVFSDEFDRFEADIYTFNLVIHHFENQDIKNLIERCVNSGGKVLINDLQRSKIAHFLFQSLSRLLRFSEVSVHDGLLSVRKGFVRSDWVNLLASQSIKEPSISWRWAFRYLVLIY